MISEALESWVRSLRACQMFLWAGKHLLQMLAEMRHFVDCKPLNVKDAICLAHLQKQLKCHLFLKDTVIGPHIRINFLFFSVHSILCVSIDSSLILYIMTKCLLSAPHRIL